MQNFAYLGVFLMLASLAGTASADWPQWRGPMRDGTISDFQPPQSWPETLRKGWSIEIGPGHSSPAVSGNTIVTLTRDPDKHEVIRGLRLTDGKELWKLRVAADAKVDPVVGRYLDSPRSTPTIAGERVFCLSVGGTLTAVEMKTGKRLWQHTFAGEFPNTLPEFGATASPLVIDDAVIVPVGGKDKGAIMAFELKSGKPKWRIDDEGPSYASPVLLDMTTGKQIVTQSQSHIVGFSPAGKALWKIPFETEYRQNIVTAISVGKEKANKHDLIVFGGTSKPLAAITFDKPGQPSIAWENPEFALYMSSPVTDGTRIFGMASRDSGVIFAVDARTGKTLWRSPGRAGENVSVQRSGKVLVLQNDRGELRFVDAVANEYKELAKYDVAATPVFAHPIIANDHILIKDESTLTQWLWK